MDKFWRTNSTGKQQNLQNWCKDSWTVVYRYVYGFVQNREEAEDITQETYTHTLRKLSSPEDLPNKSYLKTVALNIIRDRWRRLKVRGKQVPLEDYRTVLQLRIIQGYSRAETASQMGRTEDSIRGLQYRALQSLKNLLDKNLEEADKQ